MNSCCLGDEANEKPANGYIKEAEVGGSYKATSVWLHNALNLYTVGKIVLISKINCSLIGETSFILLSIFFTNNLTQGL